ncbi:alpha/beta fold hydrolase [Sphingobium sp.]|uniref:alpha/beta fold hydrolase n=1 Tax=Sphingobium sp. TaxID=1912891 RepID=UPI0028BD42F6|nr:alpha/beta fold hydrolase [Sphingobium sp.]
MTIEKTAVAADGVKLHYSIHGSGPLRLALTHSLAMTGSFWTRLIDALGDHATVLSWDCRGHGASDKPAGPYTVEMFGDDLATVFDAAGWDRAICAGASMGGTVTLAFAARHPARVSALGLIDTTASYGAGAPEAWEGRAQKARDEGLASLTAFQETRWFSDGFRAANPGLVAECVEIFCANDLNAYGETCRMLGAADLIDQLPAIRVPTMILVGDEDYATPPPMAEQMHGLIGGSTLEIIAGARHLTPLECPDLIADRLLTLARKVEA